MAFTGPYSSWFSTPSPPYPISLPKESPMTQTQPVVPVGNWHISSLLELLFLPLDFLLFLLVWLWSNGEPVALCWQAMQSFSLQFKGFSLYLEEEMILAGSSGSTLFWLQCIEFLRTHTICILVHMQHFTMKFNMLGFLIPLYHVHFKEDFLSKRWVLFSANRPVKFRLCYSNYVTRLAVHVVMVLSDNMLTQSCRQLPPYAVHVNLLLGDVLGEADNTEAGLSWPRKAGVDPSLCCSPCYSKCGPQTKSLNIS